MLEEVPKKQTPQVLSLLTGQNWGYDRLHSPPWFNFYVYIQFSIWDPSTFGFIRGSFVVSFGTSGTWCKLSGQGQSSEVRSLGKLLVIQAACRRGWGWVGSVELSINPPHLEHPQK